MTYQFCCFRRAAERFPLLEHTNITHLEHAGESWHTVIEAASVTTVTHAANDEMQQGEY